MTFGIVATSTHNGAVRPPADETELTPEEVSRFTFIRPLGAGAFATVWLADDSVLGSQVAIKVLADNWAHDMHVRERFAQEAKLTRRADSEWVTRVYDLGTLTDGRPYTVMSYADRGTLADRLNDGPLGLEQAVQIGLDVANGVASLHDHGILHRDLKPTNILFQSSPSGGDRTLITDLGLAKSLDEASRFTLGSGTHGYAAPEQITAGGDLDVRADVFSLGAVVRAMATGSADGGASASELPRALDHVIARATAADRQDRYASAAEFATALREATPELANTGSEPALGERTPRGRSSAWIRNAVVVGLLIGVPPAAAATTVAVRGEESVRVSSPQAGISVMVPGAWADQIQQSHWLSPTRTSPSSGFVASADVASWRDASSPMPGLAPAIMHVEAGSESGGYITTTRENFVLVMHGQFDFELASPTEKVSLEPGDSLVLSAGRSHAWKNRSTKQSAQALWVELLAPAEQGRP
jgi:eukaryotic-like serine/threonine-protein kinase